MCPCHASIGFQPTPLGIATDAAGHVYLSNPQQSRNGVDAAFRPADPQ
jgi:hypothetical protein